MRAKEMTAMQVKEKARKQNRRADVRNRIMPDVEDRLKTFQTKVLETLDDAVKPLISAGDDMAEQMDQILKVIGSEIRIIEKECGSLERGLR